MISRTQEAALDCSGVLTPVHVRVLDAHAHSSSRIQCSRPRTSMLTPTYLMLTPTYSLLTPTYSVLTPIYAHVLSDHAHSRPRTRLDSGLILRSCISLVFVAVLRFCKGSTNASLLRPSSFSAFFFLPSRGRFPRGRPTPSRRSATSGLAGKHDPGDVRRG